jgi:hypothetical protein
MTFFVVFSRETTRPVVNCGDLVGVCVGDVGGDEGGRVVPGAVEGDGAGVDGVVGADVPAVTVAVGDVQSGGVFPSGAGPWQAAATRTLAATTMM